MRNSALVAAAVLASGASAQFGIPSSSSTLSLLNSLTQLLTPSCRQTVLSLVQPNSSFAQCLNLEGLVPALLNNQTSIVPNIEDYLQTTCADPACSQATLLNATQQVSTSCAQDFNSFGIDPNVTQYFAEYYDTGRKVLCLSTNDTELLPNTTYSSNITFTGNYTSANGTSGNSTEVFCPISLLSGFETYLGTPLTNQFIINTALGANSTAYRQILEIPRNASLIRQFLCNDCVTAGLEIVLEDVPQLQNQTVFYVSTAQLNNYTGLNVPGNTSQWTLSQFYDGVCDVELSLNGTLPDSIEENAYDNSTTTATSSASGVRSTPSASATRPPLTVVTNSNSAASTLSVAASAASSLVSVGVTSASQAAATSTGVAAKRRFVRWD